MADGASLTLGSQSVVNLHTGVDNFNGSSDIYEPITPIRINEGEAIVLTLSSETSSFDLEGMSFAAVPEPVSIALIGLGGLLTLLFRRLQIS